MTAKCPAPETLLAAAEERLPAAAAAECRLHARSCGTCRAALAELRDLRAALAELQQADRDATAGISWTALSARLGRPPLSDRLPLGAVALWRQTSEFLRPSIAGTAVATVAGLALGTWLAVASQTGTSKALATEPFTVSNLVDDGARGLSAAYFGDADSESQALDGGAATRSAGETGGTEDDTSAVPGRTPATGDSGGAQP